MSYEQIVRHSLNKRPAGIIYGASQKVRHCFAGLFNGARNGWLYNDGGMFTGKAESENLDDWNVLKALGLIDYVVVQTPNHPEASKFKVSFKFNWIITELGHKVRNDDLLWEKELYAAMDKDKVK